ncbi:uncharacterized protein EV154DRAFT_482682 [Mucor mucedo]|uniref:uncharacterized protein n=1 Tax=Mucor mucedo TaxID=29922 RepID=UPI00221E6BB6|nr:uncharacterized protein EV154DRAFT_482682 [Mucor mucedo]KAI7889968.1 hypothetical protein EV154DRAFT_482682 [Mucor mucedo]
MFSELSLNSSVNITRFFSRTGCFRLLEVAHSKFLKQRIRIDYGQIITHQHKFASYNMWVKSFYIDGYTRGVSFCREELPVSSLDNVTVLCIDFVSEDTCNVCLVKNLESLKSGGHKIYQILNCNNCIIFWNRDVLASRNMFTIVTSIWNGNGSPSVFQRQSATSSVVAAPSSVTA